MNRMDIPSDVYESLIHKAVSGNGNSTRIRKAIDKGKSEPVTIAFLGGSVTVGYTPYGMIDENYATLFCNYFSDKYCSNGCTCINAGLPGPGSMMGLAFAENRVRDKQPDIMFVEFAVNNSMEKIQIIAFESLVDKLLEFPGEPAVIPIIVCSQDFYTCSSYMELVAQHYDLPVVNIYHLLKAGIEEGSFLWSDYSRDFGHPTLAGHRLIADCILRLFENLERKEDSGYSIPREACFSRTFSSFQLMDHHNLILEEGSPFEPSVTNPELPDGWRYTRNDKNQSLQVAFHCKSLFVLYEVGNSMDYGELEVSEDDTVIFRIDSYNINGWNNPDIKLVLNEDEARIHKLVIRIRRGDENKKFFILGFGVVN
ncbi:MAG TPA: SGNH/GDSL hydrolase family protein [Mobilitalea sp.]|nr:SGNH/GDSL hydrolase family protein [Mobilitalea sp.]